MTPKQMRSFALKVERFRKKVSSHRDKTREIFEEGENLLYTLQSAGEEFDSALISLKNVISDIDRAADEMSRFA